MRLYWSARRLRNDRRGDTVVDHFTGGIGSQHHDACAEARAAIHSVVSFDVSADGSRFVIPSMTPGPKFGAGSAAGLGVAGGELKVTEFRTLLGLPDLPTAPLNGPSTIEA
jgi:hypothetical protein